MHRATRKVGTMNSILGVLVESVDGVPNAGEVDMLGFFRGCLSLVTIMGLLIVGALILRIVG